jgi:hypothetical protein
VYDAIVMTMMDGGGRLLLPLLLLFRVVIFAGKMERCSHACITNVHIGTVVDEEFHPPQEKIGRGY